MKRLLLLTLFSAAACSSHHAPRQPEIRSYVFPLSVPHSDQVCVQTREPAYQPCITVGQLRRYLVTPRALP